MLYLKCQIYSINLTLKLLIFISCVFISLKSYSNDNASIDIKDYFFKNHNVKSNPDFFKAKSPLYKKSKTYEGYYLKFLFELKNIDITKLDVIIFEAKDGFKITIPLSFIDKYNPFLAIRDTSLSAGKNWEEVRDGGRVIDGGPYYLMWDVHNNKIPENYWAFGITKISFSTFKEAFGASVPSKNKNNRVMNGFQIYQSSCSGCHSINLVGGSLGLEMNVPKNFTEYLSKEFILSYSKSPASYRANAKMPAQNLLSNDEINSVITYLEAMKLNKICNSEEQCQKQMDKK
jgi:mono/diheme cytochrome c family protein